MKSVVTKSLLTVGLIGLLMAVSLQAQADITFTFEETNGTVTMTSSGVLNTSNLVPSVLPDGWGGTGTENNGTPGDIDIMGGTTFGGIDTQFGFSAGTDASAITNPGGPFASSNFTVATIVGSKSFTTYSGLDLGLRIPGIGVRGVDITGGLWTPDQNWTYNPGDTFASLGLIPGIYTVSDAQTGESITINIGNALPPAPAPAVPVPTLDIRALVLLAAIVLLMGGLMLRRKYTA